MYIARAEVRELSGAIAPGVFATIWLVLTALTGLLPMPWTGARRIARKDTVQLFTLGIRDIPVAGAVSR